MIENPKNDNLTLEQRNLVTQIERTCGVNAKILEEFDDEIQTTIITIHLMSYYLRLCFYKCNELPTISLLKDKNFLPIIQEFQLLDRKKDKYIFKSSKLIEVHDVVIKFVRKSQQETLIVSNSQVAFFENMENLLENNEETLDVIVGTQVRSDMDSLTFQDKSERRQLATAANIHEPESEKVSLSNVQATMHEKLLNCTEEKNEIVDDVVHKREKLEDNSETLMVHSNNISLKSTLNITHQKKSNHQKAKEILVTTFENPTQNIDFPKMFQPEWTKQEMTHFIIEFFHIVYPNLDVSLKYVFTTLSKNELQNLIQLVLLTKTWKRSLVEVPKAEKYRKGTYVTKMYKSPANEFIHQTTGFSFEYIPNVSITLIDILLRFIEETKYEKIALFENILDTQ